MSPGKSRPAPEDAEVDWNAVVGRALCFLCLTASDMRDKGIAAQARLLEDLGLSRQEAAALLNTTPKSITELFYRDRKHKTRRSRNGKKKR